MSAVLGTYRNGTVTLNGPAPADWFDGMELSITLAPVADEPLSIRDENWPATPEGKAESPKSEGILR